MNEICLSIGEPFTSPAWGGNFVMFSGDQIIPEDSTREYMRKACQYARKNKVYLIPERFVLMGFTCMCLISPQGRVLGAQRNLYLNTLCFEGLKGTDLEVIRTEFGGIQLCVDVDIYHPEVPRIGAAMGAQYIFCAQTIAPEDYSNNMVLSGIWNAAQSMGAFAAGVNGESHCICAPLEITHHQDGFLALPTHKTPLSAKLHIDQLRKANQRYRLNRKFYAIHRQDFFTTPLT